MHFPAQGTMLFEPPALLVERGLALRAAGDHDLPFLAELYAHTRAEELAAVPWPQSVRRAFLDSQFGLQHRHYLAHYPHADFLLVQQQARPVGRFYLARAHDGEDDLIVDISLLPQWRGQGIGAALIEAAATQAATRGRGVHLHVLHANGAARRLYERLGFSVDGDTGSHLHMRRAPAPASR